MNTIHTYIKDSKNIKGVVEETPTGFILKSGSEIVTNLSRSILEKNAYNILDLRKQHQISLQDNGKCLVTTQDISLPFTNGRAVGYFIMGAPVSVPPWEKKPSPKSTLAQTVKNISSQITRSTQPVTRTTTQSYRGKPINFNDKNTKKKMLERMYGPVCQGCSRIELDTRHLQVDHIHPSSKDGSDDIGNLMLLCGPCNQRKSNKLTLSELRQRNRDEHGEQYSLPGNALYHFTPQ